MTTIKQATGQEVASIIEKYPHTKNVMCTGADGITLVTIENEEITAFLSAFYREIPAPLDGETECFINVIEIIDTQSRGKGIGSLLVQEAIKTATEKGATQVRAYCEIQNKSSHMLWHKNGFGISPIKHHDGSIYGSFVTYRIPHTCRH